MKTLNYYNANNLGGIALDKRRREFKYFIKKEFNTPDMIRIAENMEVPVEIITLTFNDIRIFHNFRTGILGNQLN